MEKQGQRADFCRFTVVFSLCLLVALVFGSRLSTAENMDPGAEVAQDAGLPVAEPPAEKPIRKPIPLAITTSGGVSQGAYQAGYLFYLTEAAKLNPNLIVPRLLSGTSAGMINNLLTVMALGNGTHDAPGESLFFKVWTESKYNELLDIERAPPMALSSRAVLKRMAGQVEKEWDKGLSEEVDVVIGAMASRIENRMVRVTDVLSLPRQEEKFIFRIKGRGRGRATAVSNYVDRLRGTSQPLLPFVDVSGPGPSDKRRNFASLRQILFASSSVPILFLPQVIDYCLSHPDHSETEGKQPVDACVEPTHRDLFIDGSLADKRPLRLARRIAASSLEENDRGDVVWRDMPDLTRAGLPDDLYFLYIDPTRRTYPDKAPILTDEKAIKQVETLFPSMGGFIRNFFASAQANELSDIVDDYPDIRDKLELVIHDFPTIGGQLINFFGFFDREFRKFDFYLGMRDANRYLRERLTPRIREAFADETIEMILPEPEFSSGDGAQMWGPKSWRRYACLLAEIDGRADLRSTCQRGDIRDFRILLQATLDRLYDHCRTLPYDGAIDNHHCKRAMMGMPPPRTFKVANEDHDWKRDREGGETQIEHTMRLLEAYQFQFKDLGLDYDDADLGMSRIRAELLRYVDAFGAKLPFGERLTLHLLGKPAVNFFAYAPPETIMTFLAGTGAEFAVSATMGRSRWLRYNFGLHLRGIDTLLTGRPNVFSMAPMVGLEAEIFPLSGPLFQTRLGLRVGYQFSTGDVFFTESCNTADFKDNSLVCSAPLVQGFLAVSFYERVRLQVGLEWLPEWLPPMDKTGKHLWNALFLVGWQWLSPF